jgi:hypothetical protein
LETCSCARRLGKESTEDTAPPTGFRPLPQISYLPIKSSSTQDYWWQGVDRWRFGTKLICKNPWFGLVHIPTAMPKHRRDSKDVHSRAALHFLAEASTALLSSRRMSQRDGPRDPSNALQSLPHDQAVKVTITYFYRTAVYPSSQ